MSDVPDPVFSGEILGKGCAVWRTTWCTPPVSGKVTVTMGHAVGIMSDSGVEVLVHVGVDTVNLQGKGLPPTSPGDAVVAGQPVQEDRRSVIAEAGYEDCVVVAVSNSAELRPSRWRSSPRSSLPRAHLWSR